MSRVIKHASPRARIGGFSDHASAQGATFWDGVASRVGGARGKGGAGLHRMGGGIRRRSGWVEERESPPSQDHMGTAWAQRWHHRCLAATLMGVESCLSWTVMSTKWPTP